MKKVLIGICGIGNGHINRQKLIIDELLKYDVEIVLAVTDNCRRYFNTLYPKIKKVNIYVPWIFCNNNGIDFKLTEQKYIEQNKDWYKTFLNFSIKVQTAFNNNNPDFVISDYEPNVAQFAYATNKPLICLDQHSKFLNLNSEMINGFSINIERSRLLYFFPHSDQRYVSSFFKIENNEDLNIKVLPPIVKKIKRTKIEKNKVVVYFSTYSNNSVYYKSILNLIKTCTDYKFYIYSDIEYPKYTKFNNLVFKKIGPEFDMDLSNCNFIISSSGHQLISEAINLGIPLYIFPLDTFDQNYCCKMVEKNSFGKAIKKCNKTELNQFINNIDVYRNKMLDYKRTNWNTSWERILFKDLEKKFGIVKL